MKPKYRFILPVSPLREGLPTHYARKALENMPFQGYPIATIRNVARNYDSSNNTEIKEALAWVALENILGKLLAR